MCYCRWETLGFYFFWFATTWVVKLMEIHRYIKSPWYFSFIPALFFALASAHSLPRNKHSLQRENCSFPWFGLPDFSPNRSGKLARSNLWSKMMKASNGVIVFLPGECPVCSWLWRGLSLDKSNSGRRFYFAAKQHLTAKGEKLLRLLKRDSLLDIFFFLKIAS